MNRPKIVPRWQQVPVIAAGSIGCLLVAGVLVTLYNDQAYRAERRADAQAQAQVVAASVAGALAFDDRVATREYLGALKANPLVDAAAVYDAQGGLAASYAREPNALPPGPAKPGVSPPDGDHLVVQAPVAQGSTRLGAVFLRTDADPFARRAARYGWVALLALMGSVVAAVLAAAHATMKRTNVELAARAADLHEIAARQRAILNSAMDAIVTLSPSGAIQSINPAGERMFGHPADALVGAEVDRLIELDPAPSGSLIDRLAVSRETLAAGLVRELTARRRNGDRFPVDVALGLMELPDGPHLVAMIHDISDRKRAEQLKNEFVSTVSHELRTPLTSIAGSLGLLNGGAAGALPPQADRLIEIAHANCGRLIRLINDILDIEKIESGRMVFDMRPLTMAALVQQSIDDLRGYAEGLGVSMTFERRSPAMVHGDPDRIIQVVTNLISNAVKFSPPGGAVELSLRLRGGFVCLAIRDQGPGVPESFRSRIFSKFAQADSTDTRQKGGTGLGLAISKEIAERHKGRLWFTSEPGRGAVFHLDLPVAAPIAARARA